MNNTEQVIDTAYQKNFRDEQRELKKRFTLVRKFYIADLIKATEIAEGFSSDELFSELRPRHFSHARWRIYYIAQTRLVLSVSHIGRLMHRDHSSVMYGIKKYLELFENDEEETARRGYIKFLAEKIYRGEPVTKVLFSETTTYANLQP